MFLTNRLQPLLRRAIDVVTRGPFAVGCLAAALYARSIGFDFTNLDDRDLVVADRAFLARPSSLWRAFGARAYMHVVEAGHAYYRPVVTASYVLDAQWGGPRPLAYHVTNVVLFAVVSVLVYALYRRFALGAGLTLVAALAFAVHPALAPAVAWIPGRNDTLLAIFALGAWLAFLRDCTAASSALFARAAHFGLFALALLTKEASVVVPLVCLLHVALLEPAAWARLRRSRVFAVYALGWCALLAGRMALRMPAANPRDVIDNLALYPMSLGKLLVPSGARVLAVASDLSVWPGLLGAGAIAVATWLLPVRCRVVAFGGAVFALFLAPAVALPGSLVLDHRLVLPACGAIIVLAEIVRALPLERSLMLAFAGVTVAVLGALTIAYQGAFRDRRAFAREAAAGSPRSALAHFCLAQSLQIDGEDDRALAEYRTALALGPSQVVHNNIAVIEMARGQWADAERDLRAELVLNPEYAKAYGNLGIVLRHQGRFDEACAAAGQAVERDPEDEAWRRERARDCEP
jgi:tetratricopeptide (TPR) repeat protein